MATEPVVKSMRQMSIDNSKENTQEVQWQAVKPFFDLPSDSSQMKQSKDTQVMNSAGGFVYKVSDTMRVRRFLILGTSGGTYYASEHELTTENAQHIVKMIQEGKGLEVLKELHDINKANRAPKMSPLVFCLAVVLRNTTDDKVKFRAYQLLPLVCRIPTHLFEFMHYYKNSAKSVVEGQKISLGWGRAMRHRVSDWYLRKGVMQLALAVTKYQCRNKWTHRDVLRLAHVKPDTRSSLVTQAESTEASEMMSERKGEYHNDIFLYCTQGMGALLARHKDAAFVEDVALASPGEKSTEETDQKSREPENKPQEDKKEEVEAATAVENKEKAAKKLKAAEKKKIEKEHKMLAATKRFNASAPNHLRFLQAVEDLKVCQDEQAACQFIERFDLVREHVPSRLLNSVAVWRMLLSNMPMTAMIRNLGKMSAIKLIVEEDNAESALVCSKLNDVEAIKAARVHPIVLLMALAVYRRGQGEKGSLKWTPNPSIVDSLEKAFYAAFVNVEPTGKRFLLALDVSGSMTCALQGSALTCREASAAMAMVTMRSEQQCEVVAFQDKLTSLPINSEHNLPQVLDMIKGLPFGATDCALPMLWAAQQQKHFDCFVVYTDNETYFGDVKPCDALRFYRQASGIADAKLIVVGMTATDFTIADPDDPNMMDVVGFDSAAPELMRSFLTMGFGESPAPDGAAGDAAWNEALKA